MNRVRVAMCQINPVVGDIKGNCSMIIDYMGRARQMGADIALFPELAITGYPPEDLLLRQDFCEANEKAIEKVIKETDEIVAVVGFVRRRRDIFNSAVVAAGGKAQAYYDKACLPNYGVFDEHRYFAPGRNPLVFRFREVLFGVTICEDIWYPDGPHVMEAAGGAQVILNLSASPYHLGKWDQRENMVSTRAADMKAFVAYCNMTGGQDELVFDGGSIFVDEHGEICGRMPLFEESIAAIDVDSEKISRERLHGPRGREGSRGKMPVGDGVTIVDLPPLKVEEKRKNRVQPLLTDTPSQEEEVLKALVTGTRDYVLKNGFKEVVVGLSGGIDSSLVAAIAVQALGAGNVMGVSMPSLVTSRESTEDARTLAGNLNIDFRVIPILDLFDTFKKSLQELFSGREEDVTEENLQARVRGMILMAISNKFSRLVLTTGNKSEMSVGYATLYGDMAGGFAVIKDVYKSMVYRLSRHINERSGRVIIPHRVLEKEPSAELREGQKDLDSLPPYEVLDPILEGYIEEDLSLDEISEKGYPRELVRRVMAMVDGNEYKRRQAPPGVRITQRGLGKDRRMPITNRFKT